MRLDRRGAPTRRTAALHRLPSRLSDARHAPDAACDACRRRARSRSSNGLHHVYVGNVHDPARQTTLCPACGRRIGRDGYDDRRIRGSTRRALHECGATLAGVFAAKPGKLGLEAAAGRHRAVCRVTCVRVAFVPFVTFVVLNFHHEDHKEGTKASDAFTAVWPRYPLSAEPGALSMGRGVWAGGGRSMDDLREMVRSRAYTLWERAGRPQGRSQEFWIAAQQEIGGDAASIPFDPFEPPVDEPPEVAFLHGVPVGAAGRADRRAGGAGRPARRPPAESGATTAGRLSGALDDFII